jgi:predicted GIY-YIG superfamily endonuclease
MINTTNRVNEALNYEKEIKKEEQEKKFKSKLINEFKLVEDSNKLV